MALLLLYLPVVVLLPIVLLALVFFVVVPGGFVIVLGAAAWVLFVFIGVLRLAAESLLDSASANWRRVTARLGRRGSTTPSPAGRPTAHFLPALTTRAMTARLGQTLIQERAESDGVDRLAPPDDARAHNPRA